MRTKNFTSAKTFTEQLKDISNEGKGRRHLERKLNRTRNMQTATEA